MIVAWNKVTWFSKIAAIVLFVGIFVLGFWLGNQKGVVTATDLLSPSTKAVDALRSDAKGVEIWNSKNGAGLKFPIDVAYGSTTKRIEVNPTSYGETKVPTEGQQYIIKYGQDSFLIANEEVQEEGSHPVSWNEAVLFSLNKETNKWDEILRAPYANGGGQQGAFHLFSYEDVLVLISLGWRYSSDSEYYSMVQLYYPSIGQKVTYREEMGSPFSTSIKYASSSPQYNVSGYLDRSDFDRWLNKTATALTTAFLAAAI